MKTILGFLAIALFSVSGFARITSDNEYLLNKFMGNTGNKVQLGTLLTQTPNLLVARYSYAVQGGSSAADISLITDLTKPTSYAVLPNKAIIKNVWIDTLTNPTSNGSATIALKAVNAADLLAATAKASFTGFLQGIPFATSTSTIIKTTASKTIKATVGVATLTAGKFDVYIEWVLGN